MSVLEFACDVAVVAVAFVFAFPVLTRLAMWWDGKLDRWFRDY